MPAFDTQNRRRREVNEGNSGSDEADHLRTIIGDPVDAEPFAVRPKAVWTKLPIPDRRLCLMRWRVHVYIQVQASAWGAQVHVARTSDPATDATLVPITPATGTLVCPPADAEGGLRSQDQRAWLGQHGLGRFAMIGNANLAGPINPPLGKVPL